MAMFLIMNAAKAVAKPALHLPSIRTKDQHDTARRQHILRLYNLRLFMLIAAKWAHVLRSQQLFTRSLRLFSIKLLQLILRLPQWWHKRLRTAQQGLQLSLMVHVCSLAMVRRQHIQRRQQAMAQARAIPLHTLHRPQCLQIAQREQQLNQTAHACKAQALVQRHLILRQHFLVHMTALAHQVIRQRHLRRQIAQREQQPNQTVHVWKAVQRLHLQAVLLSFTQATQQLRQARHRLMATHLTVHMPRQIICLSANRAVLIQENPLSISLSGFFYALS